MLRKKHQYRQTFGQRCRNKVSIYYKRNVKQFLLQTTLHALKYVGDDTISAGERSFFFGSFVIALTCSFYLITNIYGKWSSIPVIIGINPNPTSILDVPFPAVTICNLNKIQLNHIANYSEQPTKGIFNPEFCSTEDEHETSEHPNPCSKMLLYCKINGRQENCLEMFREDYTEEGLCCVFNVLHPSFLYKRNNSEIRDQYLQNDLPQPVDWNPETGYQKDLPQRFYPRRAVGKGVTMGLTLILQGNISELPCSSINGPGFRVALHNAIELPDIRESGLTVPIGFETRFRINTIQTQAVPGIRSINQNARQCLFQDEAELLYYKYYTRRNCERECASQLFLRLCNCIPIAFPLIYKNSSVCAEGDTPCTEKVLAFENDNYCQKRCFPPCFNLNYMPDFFSSPLARRNYTIANGLHQNITKSLRDHIAIAHFYYEETVFYGELKNVYVGLTEFLSNTGGIMGLFMGFSVISLVEVIYFIVLRPIFECFSPLKRPIRPFRPVKVLKVRALKIGDIMANQKSFK